MAQAMIDHANEKYNLDHTIEVFRYHNIFKDQYVDDAELNKEIAQSMVDNVIHNGDAILKVKVYEGVLDGLKRLQRIHSIHFITSRAKEERDATVQWMRINKIPFDTVHCTGSSPPGGSSKGMLGRALNLDFYIDDQDKHLEGMLRYKARWRKPMALLTRPWNEWMPLNSVFIRLSNWEEIIRHLGIHKR
jgi:uncharacterized HAD superfamily protein